MKKNNIKTVLVAGAGGYLGTCLIPALLESGYKVIALDRYYFGDVYSKNSNPLLTVVKDDIRTVKSNLLKGVWAVINLAAISNDPASELNPKITQSVNHEGAVYLAKLSKKNKVSKYIFASSCSVYGHGQEILTEESKLAPISEYARSKIEAEAEILKLSSNSFCTTILRKGTLHGLSVDRMRFDLIVNIMTLHAWKNNKIFIMGGGNQWRPLLHVRDAVQAYLDVLSHKKITDINGQIFNVGSDKENYKVYQVAAIFKDYFPSIVIETTPDDPDKRDYHVSFAKIKKILKYEPKKSVSDSIKEIKEALEKSIITDSLKTKTVNYYQYLIDADVELSRIKLNNNIF